VWLTRKGRLIQDESNVNPFTGRFLDYKFSYRLHRVSVSNSTLVRLQCTFKTDAAYAGSMQAQWEQIFLGIIQSLALHPNGRNRQVVGLHVFTSLLAKLSPPGSLHSSRMLACCSTSSTVFPIKRLGMSLNIMGRKEF
jgi:hypothetical protein